MLVVFRRAADAALPVVRVFCAVSFLFGVFLPSVTAAARDDSARYENSSPVSHWKNQTLLSPITISFC